jgi:hypothetical protein
MYEVGGGAGSLGEGLENCWVSRSSKRMPPFTISQSVAERQWDIPGSLCESLIRSMRAKSGKWFRHASRVSNAAFREIIAMREHANVR